MTKAEAIRQAFAGVAALRAQAATQPALGQAIVEIKALQAERFAGTYADELHGGRFEVASRFFLTELYSAQDYTQRDAQFTRIAGAIDKLFPDKVSSLALALAQLHALTEELDSAMGQAWLKAGKPRTAAERAHQYVGIWRQTGRADDRYHQLTTVLGIGEELARLTRLRGLRTLLRMMRGPASAAGLTDLQHFMETGFDTFADLGKQPGGTEAFLRQIEERETALMKMLFEADLVTCETALVQTLGKP
jgi:hypothetical protein